jgi:hypothetical protein
MPLLIFFFIFFDRCKLMVNLNAFVIGLFSLMLTTYTIAYALDCDLATKHQQQQPSDITADSDVLPYPEQLPPPISPLTATKMPRSRRDLRSVLFDLDYPIARVRSS